VKMFFIFFEKCNLCRDCLEWGRHTCDYDGLDTGLCGKFNRLTLESYDCSQIYTFLNEIGFEHTTSCEICDFKTKDEHGDICKAKQRLNRDGWRILDKESCPIRHIYKYIKQEEMK